MYLLISLCLKSWNVPVLVLVSQPMIECIGSRCDHLRAPLAKWDIPSASSWWSGCRRIITNCKPTLELLAADSSVALLRTLCVCVCLMR